MAHNHFYVKKETTNNQDISKHDEHAEYRVSSSFLFSVWVPASRAFPTEFIMLTATSKECLASLNLNSAALGEK